jgi:VIT1/CCC1 family predicted Fe2+/Mn2+ transporter
LEIANSLDIEVRDSRSEEQHPTDKGRREDDPSEIKVFHGEVEQTSADNLEEDERPLVLRMASALVHFIPGLTPLLSLLYKNLALTVLSALFIAFVSYGLMIAYFLTSGDWSSPLQLQRGHELVIKAERDRGELQVKRNLVTQQLADAENKASRGHSSLERAETLAQIAKVTITQEIENRVERQKEIAKEVDALQSVLNSYGSAKSRRTERARLQNEFKQRVITRTLFQRSMLNLSQLEENVVNLREKISLKTTEQKLGDQSIAYLAQLKSQLTTDKEKIGLYGGKAEFCW